MKRSITSLLVINLLFLPGCFRACSEAEDVTFEEFGPREALRKYTWLKDTSAALDKKIADIQVLEIRVGMLKARFAESKSQRDSDNLNQAEAELAGTILSYNDLASKYNAKMSEVHWQFADVGELPKGAVSPLPREYKPYLTGK